MQNISRQAIEELLSTSNEGPLVTIYAPMHTTTSPPHISENQIRLKNLIREAIQQLPGDDAGKQLAAELQEMLDNVYDDLTFWEGQTPGLVICARAGTVTMFHLPVDTEEYVAVDDMYHLGPVLAILGDEHDFYVLSVNQHNPALLKGDMYGLHPSGIELPADLRSALNIDEPNRKTENQGSAVGTSSDSGWFNGRGGAKNPEEDDRMKFFRLIDEMLCKSADTACPLILAGIESETVEFRDISKYPSILKETIKGSFNNPKPEDLFDEAHAIIQKELVEPAREAAVEEYKRLEGANPERVARELDAIETATNEGRVDKLLASMDRHTTDTIRDTKIAVNKITFPDFELSKKLNRLATKVWQMSGSVINLTAGEMPHDSLVVARLRY